VALGTAPLQITEITLTTQVFEKNYRKVPQARCYTTAMRRVWLCLPLILAGCSFGYHARRSSAPLPGSYQRAIKNARLIGNQKLVSEVEALGESHDYNLATYYLVGCMANYAEGLKWRRQYEKGDLMTENSLKANAIRRHGHIPWHAFERYEPDLRWIHKPAAAWESKMSTCQELCRDAASMGASARDRRLAAKYGGICTRSAQLAIATRTQKEDRKGREEVDRLLARADDDARSECFLRVEGHLKKAARAIEAMKEPAPALSAKLAAARTSHAEGLDRVARYRADQRFLQLDGARDRNSTSEGLVRERLSEVRRRMTKTGSSTTYNAYGGQTGRSSGDPVAYDRLELEQELLHEKREDLRSERENIQEALVALQREFRIYCR
jgi:hypothetical protein